MKILVLSDLHVGITGESTTHPGIIRQANSQSLEALENLIPKFNSLGIDLTLQLGDLIRDSDRIKDRINIELALDMLARLKMPVVNLIGNHEVKNLTKTELEVIFTKKNLNSKFYGVKSIDNLQLIWFDFEKIDSEVRLNPDLIKEIELELKPESTKIVFSHYAAVNKQVEGNFYFEGKEINTRYFNGELIREFLNRHKIKLFINGHEHWISLKTENETTHLTLPSFCENILKNADVNVCPGVYSVLEIVNDKVIANTYSGEYGFFHTEVEI